MTTATALPNKTDGAERMMVVAVSNITYLRGVFPEDAYRSRYLEDLCLKILREDSAEGGACRLVRWLIGSFDALEKSYLQMVLIGVCPDPKDINHIIESYQFKFVYTEDGPQMDVIRVQNGDTTTVTMGNTKKASVLLIRKLFLLLQNLDLLPDDVALTMRLYYYDDVTPPDYEPPGFEEGVCDELWFEGVPSHFKVGEVETAFHAMKVRVVAAQGRARRLQEGNHLSEVETTPVSKPEACSRLGAGDHRSSDEESAAEFKKPPVKKMRSQVNRKAKRNKNEL